MCVSVKEIIKCVIPLYQLFPWNSPSKLVVWYNMRVQFIVHMLFTKWWFYFFKGIIHTEMLVLTSFTNFDHLLILGVICRQDFFVLFFWMGYKIRIFIVVKKREQIKYICTIIHIIIYNMISSYLFIPLKIPSSV